MHNQKSKSCYKKMTGLDMDHIQEQQSKKQPTSSDTNSYCPNFVNSNRMFVLFSAEKKEPILPAQKTKPTHSI